MSETTTLSVPEQTVTVSDEPMELQMVAHSRDQMVAVQTKLLAWADRKLDEQLLQMEESSTAKTVALAAGFETGPFTRALVKAVRLMEFYEKIKAAIEAGYVIIPDFPVDVFAIRTTRRKPLEKESTSTWANRSQASESPPIGEGEWKDSNPVEHQRTYPEHDSKGVATNVTYFHAHEYRDVIDFPMSIAKAEIMDDVACAMQNKIFDEIGVLPDRLKTKKDPIVTGIIRDPRSTTYNKRRVMFLIAWYLDTRTI